MIHSAYVVPEEAVSGTAARGWSTLPDGVRLFAPFPDDYDALGMKSIHQRTDIGPCLLIYDRRAWNTWDAPFWQEDAYGGRRRPAQPGGQDACRLCGQDIACLNGGPGALALWQGAPALRIIQALTDADEEEDLNRSWLRFLEHARQDDLFDFRSLAEHVASEGFRGWAHVRKISGAGMDWMDADCLAVDGDEQGRDPMGRKRALPKLLRLLAALGVRVPVSSTEPEGISLSRLKAASADVRRRLDEVARKAVEDIRRRTPQRPPLELAIRDLVHSPTPAEELAEALMGYDHATGDKRPWGPFGRTMKGHNNPPD